YYHVICVFFFFQAEDGIRDRNVTGVQTCALPIFKKYNKSLNSMIKGITSLFFVIVIIALVVFVTGPIGEFFGITNLYQFINDFIATHESIWRYLMVTLYLVSYVGFGIILWLVALCLREIT